MDRVQTRGSKLKIHTHWLILPGLIRRSVPLYFRGFPTRISQAWARGAAGLRVPTSVLREHGNNEFN